MSNPPIIVKKNLGYIMTSTFHTWLTEITVPIASQKVMFFFSLKDHILPLGKVPTTNQIGMALPLPNKEQFYQYTQSALSYLPGCDQMGTVILDYILIVWLMTTKKAAKTTFFCEGVHTGRNPWICMRDGINPRECITRRTELCIGSHKKVRNGPPSTRLEVKMLLEILSQE